MGAASDNNGGLGDFEVFGEKFDEGGVSFAIMGFGAEVNGELVWCGFDDFFLAGAGLDGDLISIHDYIIP